VNESLEDVVRQEVEALGFELFELRRGGSRQRPVLDVRIDRRDEEKVTVEDCTRVSRTLEARLDTSGQLGERYVLEVSSPGVERPLRHAADWRRFAGRRAVVTSDALGGSSEVEIVGVEGNAGSEVGVVRTAKGEERRVPLASVRRATLTFDWKS
jgi:ribosome maturation factor RimP